MRQVSPRTCGRSRFATALAMPLAAITLTWLAGPACADPMLPSIDMGNAGMTRHSYAVAHAGGVTGTANQSGTDTSALTVETYAYDPVVPPELDADSQHIQMTCSGAKLGMVGAGHITSDAAYRSTAVSGAHSFFASGTVTSGDFDLAIGSTSDYPAGTPMTMAITSTSTVTGAQWNSVTWSLDIGGLHLDPSHPSGVLAVTAGQTITGVSWNFYAESAGGLDEMGMANVVAAMALIPEPGTLAFLALGGVTLLGAGLRRRFRHSA
ncbi:MAG: PEP-CTERM sorting domain-containing protein [Phycisphaerae bacterium]|nr:PEP-CTERM sorting domain-containing protein [Phycisphaerae bacterium]